MIYLRDLLKCCLRNPNYPGKYVCFYKSSKLFVTNLSFLSMCNFKRDSTSQEKRQKVLNKRGQDTGVEMTIDSFLALSAVVNCCQVKGSCWVAHFGKEIFDPY